MMSSTMRTSSPSMMAERSLRIRTRPDDSVALPPYELTSIRSIRRGSVDGAHEVGHERQRALEHATSVSGRPAKSALIWRPELGDARPRSPPRSAAPRRCRRAGRPLGHARIPGQPSRRHAARRRPPRPAPARERRRRSRRSGRAVVERRGVDGRGLAAVGRVGGPGPTITARSRRRGRGDSRSAMTAATPCGSATWPERAGQRVDQRRACRT